VPCIAEDCAGCNPVAVVVVVVVDNDDDNEDEDGKTGGVFLCGDS
jgi:hypothetical protein